MYNEAQELSEELFRLERTLRKSIFGSKEFKRIKKKIEEMGLDMHVVLMVMAQERKGSAIIKKKKREFGLSSQDKAFLKSNKIRW